MLGHAANGQNSRRIAIVMVNLSKFSRQITRNVLAHYGDPPRIRIRQINLESLRRALCPPQGERLPQPPARLLI